MENQLEANDVKSLTLKTFKLEQEVEKQRRLKEIYNAKKCILELLLKQVEDYTCGSFKSLPADFDLLKILDAIKGLQTDLDSFRLKANDRRIALLELRSSIFSLTEKVKINS